jgi:hypothetical protein
MGHARKEVFIVIVVDECFGDFVLVVPGDFPEKRFSRWAWDCRSSRPNRVVTSFRTKEQIAEAKLVNEFSGI